MDSHDSLCFLCGLDGLIWLFTTGPTPIGGPFALCDVESFAIAKRASSSEFPNKLSDLFLLGLGPRLIDDDREPGNSVLPLNEGNIGDRGEGWEALEGESPTSRSPVSTMFHSSNAIELRLLRSGDIFGDDGEESPGIAGAPPFRSKGRRLVLGDDRGILGEESKISGDVGPEPPV